MKQAPPKYIFVTGGVLSGVGKGITAASLGATLKARGVSVSMQKCDPYLNVDAGTLNPAEHGECYVTSDGAETDLDLGHYERFLDEEMTKNSATLSGQLLSQLITDERAGKFLGKTIQLVPHLTNSIKQAIKRASKASDVHLVELGGTVGDYEGLSFVEAIREFAAEVGGENCVFVHVVYVPYLSASREFKTKPAQNAIRDLRGFGIMPDFIVARTDQKAPAKVAEKLSLFGGVPREAVALLPNAKTVYQVPLTLVKSGVADLVAGKLGFNAAADMKQWQDLVDSATNIAQKKIKIAVVAKYLDNEDTYFSVIEALKAASWAAQVDLSFDWIDAQQLEVDGCAELANYDGILVPGGFGTRGIEGMIAAADYALTNDKPYLGICLGLQTAVVAAARAGGLASAVSSEVKPTTKTPVVYIMEEQKGLESTGGTMRLGDYPAQLLANTKTRQLYGLDNVAERHRHRYEVNRAYEDYYEKGGLSVSGQSPNGQLVEFVEAPKRKFFVATQAHPEFKSRPMRAHPLFVGFVEAVSN